MDETGRLIHILQMKTWKLKENQAAEAKRWFGSIFFCYSQSRCHQTSWYSHRNPWFPDSTRLLFHFGRSRGMQCRPCRASKMIRKRNEELQIIPENLCILITGVFCVRWNTVPPLGYPSLEIRPLWRWGNLARPEQKAEEYLHQCTIFRVAFDRSVHHIYFHFFCGMHSFLPCPTQCHYWCFWAIWWRHRRLHLSQRRGNVLSHCLRWLDPGIIMDITLSI